MRRVGLSLLIALSACAAPIRREALISAPRVHTVLWTGTEAGFRIAPDSIEVVAGDSLHFMVGSGAPHNLVFDWDRLSVSARNALTATIPQQVIDPSAGVTTRFQVAPGQGFTFSTATLPPGRYPFFCRAHYALGEKGLFVVHAR